MATNRERTPMWGIERPGPQASESPHVPREIPRGHGPASLDKNRQFCTVVLAGTAKIELLQEVSATSSPSTSMRFQCALAPDSPRLARRILKKWPFIFRGASYEHFTVPRCGRAGFTIRIWPCGWGSDLDRIGR